MPSNPYRIIEISFRWMPESIADILKRNGGSVHFESHEYGARYFGKAILDQSQFEELWQELWWVGYDAYEIKIKAPREVE